MCRFGAGASTFPLHRGPQLNRFQRIAGASRLPPGILVPLQFPH